MNGFNEQSFDEVLVQEPTRLKIQWDEGMPFKVQLQQKNKINTGLRADMLDVAELFRSEQRKPKGYTEFLKQAG